MNPIPLFSILFGTLIADTLMDQSGEFSHMTKERRRHSRVRVSHPVLYFTNSYSNPRLALAVDISISGTQIESPHRVVENEELEIAIHTELLIIKCRGKVVYVLASEDGRIRAGIEFQTLSEHDKPYLRHHLFHILEQKALAAYPSLG